MENHSTKLNFNILNTILDNRYSCRSFLKKGVRKKTIINILNTAQKVPSWCNAQPWQVQIISGKSLKRLTLLTLAAAKTGMQSPDIDFPSSYLGTYKNRRRECAEQLYDSAGIIMGDRVASKKQMLKNFNFFKAPCVALITTPKELGVYGVLDCGAYVTAFALAATSLGLASIPQAALAGLSPVLRDFLNIPDNRNIVCVISFGYANERDNINKFRTTRANSKDVQELDIN